MNKSKKIILTLCLASKLVWGYSSTVYQVQQQLNELGYRISVDGKMGQKTAKAIQQYQQDNGLRVNGRVTKEVLTHLGINTTNTSYKTEKSNSDNLLTNISDSLSNSFRSGNYQIGFLAGWPAYGLSLKMKYNNKTTLELLAAPLGTFSIYSVKINYYLQKEAKYNTYAYISGGIGIYDYHIPKTYNWETEKYSPSSDTEKVPMVGAGIGVEWSWRKVLGQNVPNLYSTLELGYANLSFDHYDFGGFLYGAGLYYKF